MLNRTTSFLALSLSILVFSCAPPEEQIKRQEQISNSGSNATTSKQVSWDGNVRMIHRPDGTLKSTMPYLDGKKHGLGQRYYPDGSVHQAIEYENGVKQGYARTYYESGKLAVESQYRRDKLHGIRKRFDEAGFVMAEIPYKNGRLSLGTVEYLAAGVKNPEVPHFLYNRKNADLVTVSLEGFFRSAKWYIGYALTPDDTLPVGARSNDGRYDGKFMDINLQRWKGQTVRIVAEVTTWQGNPMLLQTTYTP